MNETKEAEVSHRIRWYVVLDGERLPRESGMRGTWANEAECSCGWKTRTGGAVRSWIEREVAEHKWDVANGFWNAADAAAERNGI